MTERLLFDFSLSCIGEGNGNPLQCSCLENPRDGEAWWAAVYGVAQSRTRLKRLSSSSSSRRRSLHLHVLEMSIHSGSYLLKEKQCDVRTCLVQRLWTLSERKVTSVFYYLRTEEWTDTWTEHSSPLRGWTVVPFCAHLLGWRPRGGWPAEVVMLN